MLRFHDSVKNTIDGAQLYGDGQEIIIFLSVENF